MQDKSTLHRATPAGLLVALGIIYGDIGTSPLYVMKAVIGEAAIARDLVLGGISAVFWTLTLLTTLKYVVLTLRADNHGEGGIFSLYALIGSHRHKWLYIPAILGGATLLADGIITPPISVASAIEGLRILRPQIDTVPIILGIIAVLFALQQAGTRIIGRAFGPVMFLWFSMLAVLGIVAVVQRPEVLTALDPRHAWHLLVDRPGGFWLLGAIFLCSTGAEALYSDLGHCGRGNIRVSWGFVKTCLVLNYFGQGAWLLQHEGQKLAGSNPFYLLMPSWFLLPGIAIATAAAIIASQALISGSFTLIVEAIRLRLWPKMRIAYPTEMRGQVYVPALNWLLFMGCCGVVLYFRESHHMEAAYGLAITLTMLMTTFLLAFWLHGRGWSAPLLVVVVGTYVAIEGAFLVANLDKFSHGGWVSLLIAGVLFGVMLVWILGQRIRNELTEFVPLADRLPMLARLSQDTGLAKFATHLVYLTKSTDPALVEHGIIHSIFHRQPKRADVYYLVHVQTLDDPYTMAWRVTHIVPNDVVRIDFRLGFRIAPDIERMFAQVIEELVQAGEVDRTSRYPSLNEARIAGDFTFVILDRVLPWEHHLPARKQWLLSLANGLRKLATSEQEAFGLNAATVLVETVPLLVTPPPPLPLVRDVG